MKKIFFPALVCCLTACTQVDLSDSEQSKKVTFSIPSLSEQLNVSYEDMVTRASLKDNAGYLYVFVDGKLVDTQLSTDSDFGNPTLTLDYGTRNIAFVASTSAMTFSSVIMTPTDGKVVDTFGYKCQLNVTGTTGNQTASLDRIVSCLRYVVDDAMPSNIGSVELSFAPQYTTLTLTTMAGSGSDDFSKQWNLTSNAGSSGLSFTAYSFCPSLTDEFSITSSTITFRDKNDDIIATKTFDDLTLKCNRRTVVKGYFISKSPSYSITVNDAWADDKVVSVN